MFGVNTEFSFFVGVLARRLSSRDLVVPGLVTRVLFSSVWFSFEAGRCSGLLSAVPARFNV